jgi:hypothetical protein
LLSSKDSVLAPEMSAAVQTLQLGQVDSMAVKVEADQQRHDQEAGQHYAPAGLAQRLLIGRAFVLGRKHSFGPLHRQQAA